MSDEEKNSSPDLPDNLPTKEELLAKKEEEWAHTTLTKAERRSCINGYHLLYDDDPADAQEGRKRKPGAFALLAKALFGNE